VKTACAWPNCTKRAGSGERHCGPHRIERWRSFIRLAHHEGPVGLSRHSVTDAELVEYARTGQIPSSRQYQPDFSNSHVACASCGGPLVIVNDPGGKPGPLGFEDRGYGTDAEPGTEQWPYDTVCACCSFPGCRHCWHHGVQVDGHTAGADGRCSRCGDRLAERAEVAR
jgi:hypothetical protein